MASLLDFLPLFRETADSIRGRLDADVNAGVDPLSDNYLDTTEGGFYWDLTQVVVLEIERLLDMLATEVPAAAFPQYAWGDYLDEHGEVLSLIRKAAAKATGQVVFSGTNGTFIPIGVRVATAQASPDDDPVEFVTTAAGTIASGTATVNVEADTAGSKYNVPIGSLTVLINADSGVTSATNPAATSGGTDIEDDDAYRDRILLELASPQGAGNTADYRRWALSFDSVGFCTVEPVWDGAGSVRVMITDPDNNPVSGTVVSDLKTYLDPYSATTTLSGSVTLPTGTLTVASTTNFTTATATYPQRLFVDGQPVKYTGSTSTTFTGCTGGSGVIASGASVVQSGSGTGQAPIGATVWVATPAAVAVVVAANVDYDAGYSIAGAGGTISIGAEIQAAITAYINSLPPGADVILTKVVAAIVDVEGASDVSTVLLNGSATNVVISGSSVASTSTITLT